MKEIIIDGNKIEISDESFEALKKQFVKPKSWKPKNGETCYRLEASSMVSCFTWRDGYLDWGAWSLGNVFETADEAYFESDKRHLLHKIKIWNETNGNIIDWSDNTQKTSFYFATEWNKLSIDAMTTIGCPTAGAYYFKTHKLVEKFFEDFDHDELKKYLFNVKE